MSFHMFRVDPARFLNCHFFFFFAQINPCPWLSEDCVSPRNAYIYFYNVFVQCAVTAMQYYPGDWRLQT